MTSAPSVHPLFASAKIDIGYDQVHNWLHVAWKQGQDGQSVIEGCSQILRLQQKHRCEKLLMDSAQVESMWDHAAEWGSKIWFPAMLDTGLRYVAWVYSASFYSRMSFDLAIKDLQQPIVLTFNDAEQAVAWLRHV